MSKKTFLWFVGVTIFLLILIGLLAYQNLFVEDGFLAQVNSSQGPTTTYLGEAWAQDFLRSLSALLGRYGMVPNTGGNPQPDPMPRKTACKVRDTVWSQFGIAITQRMNVARLRNGGLAPLTNAQAKRIAKDLLTEMLANPKQVIAIITSPPSPPTPTPQPISPESRSTPESQSTQPK